MTDKVDSCQTAQATDRAVPGSFLFEMQVRLIESDYDVLYEHIYPHSILASRGAKYFVVNIITGEEKCVKSEPDDDAVYLAVHPLDISEQKEQNVDF